MDSAHESRVHYLFTILWYCTLYGYTIVFRCYQLVSQVKMHADPKTMVFMWMLTPTTTSIPICQYGINYHLDWSWIPSKLTHSAFPWWSYFLITANTQEQQDAVMMLFKFWTWRWKFIFWNISFVIRMQILSSLLDMFCIAQLSFDQTCLLDKLPVQ